MPNNAEDRQSNSVAASDRRAFLGNCGKFAATVPPAMAVLMSTSLVSPAIAQSGGVPEGSSGGHTDGSGIPKPPTPGH